MDKELESLPAQMYLTYNPRCILYDHFPPKKLNTYDGLNQGFVKGENFVYFVT